MSIIDEYKQAIQDVLDGRAPEPPKPSELPWAEDKAATMWAAAAAELIAEDSAGGGGGGLLVTLSYPTQSEYVCDKTAKEMWDVAQNGGAVVFKHTYNDGMSLLALSQAEKTISNGHYGFTTPTGEYFEANSDSDYPTYTVS